MIPLLLATLIGQAPVVVPDAPKGLKLRLERRPIEEWTRTHPTTSTLYALTFTNGTRQTVELVETGFWSNHKVVLTNAAGDEMPLSAKGKDLREAVVSSRRWGNRDHEFPCTLVPGELWTKEWWIDMGELYDLPPGDYNLTIEYYEQEMHYEMRVVSNRLSFEKRADPPGLRR